MIAVVAATFTGQQKLGFDKEIKALNKELQEFFFNKANTNKLPQTYLYGKALLFGWERVSLTWLSSKLRCSFYPLNR